MGRRKICAPPALSHPSPPVEQVRFGNSGTEVTMARHPASPRRIHRARPKLSSSRGCYHGVHDAVMVKCEAEGRRNGAAPASAQPGSRQALVFRRDTWKNTLIATFNDLRSAERLFDQNPGADCRAHPRRPVPMKPRNRDCPSPATSKDCASFATRARSDADLRRR